MTVPTIRDSYSCRRLGRRDDNTGERHLAREMPREASTPTAGQKCCPAAASPSEATVAAFSAPAFGAFAGSTTGPPAMPANGGQAKGTTSRAPIRNRCRGREELRRPAGTRSRRYKHKGRRDPYLRQMRREVEGLLHVCGELRRVPREGTGGGTGRDTAMATSACRREEGGRKGGDEGEGDSKKSTKEMPAHSTARQRVDGRKPTANPAVRSTQEGPKFVSGAKACRSRERPELFSRQATKFEGTIPVTSKGVCWCALQQDDQGTMTKGRSRSNTRTTALIQSLPFARCQLRFSLGPCAFSSRSERVWMVTVMMVGQLRAGADSSGGSFRSLGRAWRSRTTALEAGRPRCQAVTAVAAEMKGTAGTSTPARVSVGVRRARLFPLA